ncbi:MAG: hypothetical protein BZY77_01750 [SAR202 cluster bacterium Io17-Chloro-G5]|nr:MAG: hypothetical protein BZY77_01750 [SAR202 cluster bacterium Io17-Chloro-G5]
MQRTDPATIGIVQRYNESFNQGEVDRVMAAMTGDCMVETPIPPLDQSRFQGTRSGPGLVAGFLPVYVQHRVRQRRPMSGSVAVRLGRPRRPVEPSPQRRLFKVRNGKVAEKLVYLKG